MQFQDKTILITGGSAGIGAATARLAAAEGAAVVLGARGADRLEALAGEIETAGGRVAWAAGDVTDPGFAADLVALAESRFGALDAAFNNAGLVGEMGPVDQMTPETWRAVMATNLDAAFHGAKAQIPALRRAGGGALLFTSSFVGSSSGIPGMSAYGAAKAGVIGLAKGLAAEHGAEGIRVNALLPGGTLTEMAGDDPDFLEFARGLHALKRLAQPEEIARAALFLMSEAASFVTGAALFADGGNAVSKA